MHETPTTSLANHLLVALPSLDDPNFARSVVLLCQHDADGAMGIVVNRASEYRLGEVLSQVGLQSGNESLREQPVLGGGPVHPERGFVLHDGERDWESSLAIADSLRITTSRDVLEAMTKGEGPERAVVALGCASWGPGQLEQEIAENSWMTAPADADLLFDQPLEQRRLAAAGRIGVNLMQMTHYSGRA